MPPSGDFWEWFEYLNETQPNRQHPANAVPPLTCQEFKMYVEMMLGYQIKDLEQTECLGVVEHREDIAFWKYPKIVQTQTIKFGIHIDASENTIDASLLKMCSLVASMGSTQITAMRVTCAAKKDVFYYLVRVTFDE